MTLYADISGKKIPMRASGLTPFLYRQITGRDMIRDMEALRKNYAAALVAQRVKKPGPKPADDAPEEDRRAWLACATKYKQAQKEATLDALDLRIFASMAYVMVRQGGDDPEFPKTVEEWLDSLDGPFSIYETFPTIYRLWSMNNHTSAKPKKKYARR